MCVLFIGRAGASPPSLIWRRYRHPAHARGTASLHLLLFTRVREILISAEIPYIYRREPPLFYERATRHFRCAVPLFPFERQGGSSTWLYQTTALRALVNEEHVRLYTSVASYSCCAA